MSVEGAGSGWAAPGVTAAARISNAIIAFD
jgi:hypothetical protein